MNGYKRRLNIDFSSCYSLVLGLMLAISFLSCDGDPPDLGEYTGKEAVYLLDGGDSFYAINGSLIFKEKKDYSLEAIINVNNAREGEMHPAVIYSGKIDEDSVKVLLNLNPINGDDGTSTTQFSVLDDDSPIDFASLLLIDAHIKILLSEGQQQQLAATNLGKNSASNPNID